MVTVAESGAAPRDLGKLTALVPSDLVDAVLEETRSMRRRPRDLPSRVGAYFPLAMCLSPQSARQPVWFSPGRWRASRSAGR
ncbi:transposase domain-containing protein [Streptomyces sp. NPDC014734]|uniref:transposase domain-containing protein n=1 Tax=Streptomyces sp. NPDC014734 TaxID=3364886 RepID=UPI0036F5331E